MRILSYILTHWKPGRTKNITFTPNKKTVDANIVGFVQIVRVRTNVSIAAKMNPTIGLPLDVGSAKLGISGTDAEDKRRTESGWNIDQWANKKDVNGPYYDVNDDGEGGDLVTVGESPKPYRVAKLLDRPYDNKKYTLWEFETYAVAPSGWQKGQLYGGISWGFYVDGAGTIYSTPRKFLPAQSDAFKASVEMWEKQAKGPVKFRNSPNQSLFDAPLTDPPK